MNSDINIKIGKRVRDIRASRRVRQNALAQYIGVSPPHMNEMEMGKREIHAHHLVAIGKALNVDPGKFLQYEGVEPESAGQFFYSKGGNVVHIVGNESLSEETKKMLSSVIDKLLQ